MPKQQKTEKEIKARSLELLDKILIKLEKELEESPEKRKISREEAQILIRFGLYQEPAGAKDNPESGPSTVKKRGKLRILKSAS